MRKHEIRKRARLSKTRWERVSKVSIAYLGIYLVADNMNAANLTKRECGSTEKDMLCVCDCVLLTSLPHPGKRSASPMQAQAKSSYTESMYLMQFSQANHYVYRLSRLRRV